MHLAKSNHSYFVTNGAIVIHTQRLKSDPGGNLLS
ncbi:glutathione S-transferase [Escherichia coli]|nr:glutathione S-transferase [Escherichia coli]